MNLPPAEIPGDLRHAAPASRPRPNVIRLKNVLVPIDLSDLSLKGLDYAVSMAALLDAKLTLLYVVPPIIYTPELPYPIPEPPDRTKEIEDELRQIARENIPSELKVNVAVCHDQPAEGILNAAREWGSDLIILSTHGRTGLRRLFLGSKAERVVREAPCPVLVVRDDEHDFI